MFNVLNIETSLYRVKSQREKFSSFFFTFLGKEQFYAFLFRKIMLIAFNKPYGVLSQFTADGSAHRTLAEFGFPKTVYPLGRLDAESEGLLLLSDEGKLNKTLLDPTAQHLRRYHVQVEGVPSDEALNLLERGVVIQGYKTLPCKAWQLNEFTMPPRTPAIRFRKAIPTAWIALELTEGKNRQVRKMTAAVGHPTLRLIRVQIGAFELGDLPSGTWRALTSDERHLLFSK